MGCEQSIDLGVDSNPSQNHVITFEKKVEVKTPRSRIYYGLAKDKASHQSSFTALSPLAKSPKKFSLRISPPHRLSGHRSFSQSNFPLSTPKSKKVHAEPVETPVFIREYLDRMSSPANRQPPLTRTLTNGSISNRSESSIRNPNHSFRENAVFSPRAAKFTSPRRVPLTPKAIPVRGLDSPLTEGNVLRLSSNSSHSTSSPQFLSPQSLKGKAFSFKAAEAVSAVSGRIIRINTEDYSCNMQETSSEPSTSRSQDTIGKQFTFLDSLKNLEDRRATLQASKSFMSRKPSTATDAHSTDDNIHVFSLDKQMSMSRFSHTDNSSVSCPSDLGLLTDLIGCLFLIVQNQLVDEVGAKLLDGV
jgi:hypothetical protein